MILYRGWGSGKRHWVGSKGNISRNIEGCGTTWVAGPELGYLGLEGAAGDDKNRKLLKMVVGNENWNNMRGRSMIGRTDVDGRPKTKVLNSCTPESFI